MLTKERLPSLLIRIGLAFVFGFAAISGFLQPETYLYYLPDLIRNSPYALLVLHAFGVYEILLSVWLLSGKEKGYAGLISAGTLFGITATNLVNFQVVFRDVAIIFASLALMVLDWKRPSKS